MAKEEHDESKKARRQEGSRGGSIFNPQLYKAVGTLTSRWRSFSRILISGPRHTPLPAGLAAIERTPSRIESTDYCGTKGWSL
jgi:hypothetical protein